MQRGTCIALAAGIGLAAAVAVGQTRIRVDKDLVLVPVTVTDRANHLMTGLTKEHFHLFEDKVEQKVTKFWMDDAPLTVGMVFDSSASMEDKISRAREAAAAFLDAANPEDEFFVVEFNDRPALTVPLARDAGDVRNRLLQTRPKGRTALLDAIYLALQQMKRSSMSRKALLVISDGGDNASRYTEAELRSLVRESEVPVYGIGIYDAARIPAHAPDEWNGPDLLELIAGDTGGRHFGVDRLGDLPKIAAQIGNELRNRYVLGFSPAADRHDGRYHRLQVRLAPPPETPSLRVYWRPGYYAPEN